MRLVRFLLALALALHLSGVPAVMAAPCAGGPDVASDCCSRHRSELGGPVIGSCGCQAAVGTPEPASAASSVPPGGSHRADAPAWAVLPLATESVAPPVSPHADQTPVSFDPSPPRLSGSGFRC
jgi:hypothetical protein